MNKFCKTLILTGLAIGIFSVAGCNRSAEKSVKKNAPQLQTMTVALTNNEKFLYFSTTVAPLSLINVPSPVDGVITKTFFEYGNPVQKDQTILTIQSSKLEQSFQDALSSYLKAKEKSTSDQNELSANESLYKAGLISRDTYTSSKSTVAEDKLSLDQAERALLKVIRQANLNVQQILALSIEDTQKITQQLSANLSSIKIDAPTSGIAIYPLTSGSSGDDKSCQALVEGCPTKEGQILLSLGDLSGLTLKIQINEIDIHSVKVGQKATVTGVGFPGITLNGYIKSIDSQAKSSMDGGIPTFPVTVVVPTLTANEQKLISVGMSANVSITIEYPQTIMIPIQAVYQKDNKNFVKVMDKTTKKITEVEVSTGTTSMNNVEIKSGLNVGDEIVTSN